MTRVSFVRRALVLAFMVIAILAPANACSETYPNRAIRLIVPAAAGGGLDALARIMAQRASEILGQPIVIENKPGANFTIGMDAVAKAKPDGYTLLFVSSAGITINPILFPNMPLDPMKDLMPVAITTSNPFVLLVNKSVPAASVSEFVSYLKQNPGKLNHASNSASTQLVSELFKMLAGVDYVDVNFRGGGPAVLSTEAGDTQICFVDLASATAALNSERLRVMAITTPKRYPLQASIPTLAEGGVPGYSAEAWGVLMAPTGTPHDVVKILNQAFKKALENPDVIKRINAIGNVIVGASPDEARSTLLAEAEQWRRLVKERNVKFGQ
jgi:tripartite-type tricarboxylate transporter receptor subunit TctC